MNKRDGNIELLRCAMMFVIVLGHMSAMGPYSGVKAVHGVFSLSYFATDAFVFISGWYGLSFKWNKLYYILGYGLFASILLSLLSRSVLGFWDWNYSLGWFGNAYVALLLFSPILNAGLDALNEKKLLYKSWMIIALACLFSWFPLSSIININPPGWSGNSTLTLIFVYITGRVVAHSSWAHTMKFKTALAIFVCLTVTNVCWSLMANLSHGNEFLSDFFVGTRCNNAPLTIALALSVFLLFRSFKVPDFLGCLASKISPSLMSIYLLHLGAFPEVSKKIFYDYAFLPAESASGKFASFVLAAILVYSSCLCIDIVRRFLVWLSIKTFLYCKNGRKA